jgi:hypothetical protein
MSSRATALVQQASALRRVRVGETSAEGTKRVWHSTGSGVDLTTEVDEQGRAIFHELTLHRRLVRWRGGNVTTGKERARLNRLGREVGADLLFDAAPDVELLSDVIAFCEAVSGDRYVEHLAVALRSARDQSSALASDTVTVSKVQPPAVTRPPSLIDRIKQLFGL